MKPMRRLALLLLIATPAFGDERTDAVRAWLETRVPEMMRTAKLPGFAIAVVRDGETVHATAFGARDLERNLPATVDTLFGIGSITKSFVAIAILQLAEQGLLDLDDPVSKHLPFELGQPDAPIRIRHLLTHTPGFPSLATSSVLIARGLGEDTGVPMSSAADFLRFVNGATDEAEFPPGERFFYNNAGWRLLGAIVQARSGMPFHEYVTRNVIRPLGMTRTTFDTAALFADPDHLTPYRRRGETLQATGFPYPNPEDNPDFSFLAAAGGIASSVNEMTRYLDVLIEQGRYEGGLLLPAARMAAMQSLKAPRPDGHYGARGYGFGLDVTPDFLGRKLVSHGGSIAVSTAYLAFVPEARLGVVMMGNGPRIDYATVAEAVFALLLGEDPEQAVPVLGIRARMARLIGAYDTYRKVESIEVLQRGGLLYLKRPDTDGTTPLFPLDPTYRTLDFQVHSEGRSSPVVFREDPQGRMTVLVGRYVYRKRSG